MGAVNVGKTNEQPRSMTYPLCSPILGLSHWMRSVSTPNMARCKIPLQIVDTIHTSDDEWIANGIPSMKVEPGGISNCRDSSNTSLLLVFFRDAVIHTCLRLLRLSAGDIRSKFSRGVQFTLLFCSSLCCSYYDRIAAVRENPSGSHDIYADP